MEVPLVYILALPIVGYLLLVRSLRYRRINALAKDLGYGGLSRDELYKKMSLKDAQMIQSTLAQLEFPKIFTTSLQFALFRVAAHAPRFNALES